MDMENIIEYMPKYESVTKKQFSDKVKEVNAKYSESSISWLLSELKREQKISRVGRGVYIRMTGESKKEEYFYKHLETYQKIERAVKTKTSGNRNENIFEGKYKCGIEIQLKEEGYAFKRDICTGVHKGVIEPI